MASAVAVIICGQRGQCVPVWLVALFRIQRLIKEAIEALSSPIAALQETGQLVSTHCPSRLFKIQFQDSLKTPHGKILWSFNTRPVLIQVCYRATHLENILQFSQEILRFQVLRVTVRED